MTKMSVSQWMDALAAATVQSNMKSIHMMNAPALATMIKHSTDILQMNMATEAWLLLLHMDSPHKLTNQSPQYHHPLPIGGNLHSSHHQLLVLWIATLVQMCGQHDKSLRLTKCLQTWCRIKARYLFHGGHRHLNQKHWT
jgi:hypothetical protein